MAKQKRENKKEELIKKVISEKKNNIKKIFEKKAEVKPEIPVKTPEAIPEIKQETNLISENKVENPKVEENISQKKTKVTLKVVDEWEFPNRIESLLFVSGNPLHMDEIKKMVNAKTKEEVEAAIAKIEKRLNDTNSSLMITRLGDSYKINVREKYVTVAKKIVSEIELSKSLMETLAVIAWQSPVLQSEVTRVRTNKAYEDIEELLNLGFITKEKFGRSFVLKPTKKFYDYFDVEGGSEQMRKFFGKLKKVTEKQEEQKEVQKSLEVVDMPQKAEDETKTVGGLEVYDENQNNTETKKDNEDEINSDKKDIFDEPEKEEQEKTEEKPKKGLDKMIDNYKEGSL